MDSTAQTLQLARQHHQAGRLGEAVQMYQRLLIAQPGHADALHLLGLVAYQSGDFESAADQIKRAIQSDGSQAMFHASLGAVYAGQRRFDEARECFATALTMNPSLAQAPYGLGTVRLAQGYVDEAIASLQQAIAGEPQYFDAHQNLGAAYHILRRWEEALVARRRAAEIAPQVAKAHFDLGVTYFNLWRMDEAIAAYQEALRLRPNDPHVHNNLGCVYHALGKTSETVASYRRALELNSNDAEALVNLGDALRELGQADEARQCFERALRLRPDDPDAHYNLGLLLLSMGRFQEGWNEHAWRMNSRQVQIPRLGKPLWQGEPLAGRTLLVYAEQGLGDTLQMLRYVKRLEDRPGSTLLAVQPELKSLVEFSGYQNVLVNQGKLPSFDVEVPLMSLPGILANEADPVAADVPYLSPDVKLLQKWQLRLALLKGFKVGLCWQGDPTYANDRFRSISLSEFAPLANMPGVALVSLQKGFGREQLESVREAWSLTDIADELTDFHETAAVVKNLDLVITCDSAPAHLAGALGVPVWIALSKITDWRWQYDREDSPWYPTARLFRQSEMGDWSGVLARIAAELAALVKSRSDGAPDA